jgi:hypothetical protein
MIIEEYARTIPCPPPDDCMTVEEALAALGKTEAEIAESLVAGSWRGKPLDGCKCPIANYLKAMGFDVAVDQERLTTDEGEEIETPDAVSEFIEAFDGGTYPNLIEVA